MTKKELLQELENLVAEVTPDGIYSACKKSADSLSDITTALYNAVEESRGDDEIINDAYGVIDDFVNAGLNRKLPPDSESLDGFAASLNTCVNVGMAHEVEILPDYVEEHFSDYYASRFGVAAMNIAAVIKDDDFWWKLSSTPAYALAKRLVDRAAIILAFDDVDDFISAAKEKTSTEWMHIFGNTLNPYTAFSDGYLWELENIERFFSGDYSNYTHSTYIRVSSRSRRSYDEDDVTDCIVNVDSEEETPCNQVLETEDGIIEYLDESETEDSECPLWTSIKDLIDECYSEFNHGHGDDAAFRQLRSFQTMCESTIGKNSTNIDAFVDTIKEAYVSSFTDAYAEICSKIAPDFDTLK